MSEEKRALTREEMSQYDSFHYKREIIELKFAALSEEAKRAALEAENANLRKDIAGYKMADNRRLLDKLKTTHKEFDAGVRERLDIKEERFGFHPDTGEIALSKS